jgi:hypothetical protein
MPAIPTIKRGDITVKTEFAQGIDKAKCADGLWEVYNLTKATAAYSKKGIKPYQLLNAMYYIGLMGTFDDDNHSRGEDHSRGEELAVLHVRGQAKDTKARAFFPTAKNLFELENLGFRIFDLELNCESKPKNKIGTKDISAFKIAFDGKESLIVGLKVFAYACSKILGDPFLFADIRVAYEGASKLYAPPIDEVFHHLTDDEKRVMTAIHDKLTSLGCERNLEREYMMRYTHPKAKSKTFATIYLINQAWLAISGECEDLNLKLNLRHIGEYTDYLSECTDSIRRSVESAENCGYCVKKCGGVSFELDGKQYRKCPWHIFRFNDFTDQAMANYVKLIDLESAAL